MIKHRYDEQTGSLQTPAKNTWLIGNTVKVGFLKLRVIGSRAVKDGMPDIYTLESLNGDREYEFIPHHGLTRTI